MESVKSTLLSRRDLDSLLYEWLRIDELTKRERFAEHSRETFDGVLELCEQLATQISRAAQQRATRTSRASTARGSLSYPRSRRRDAFANADLMSMAMGEDLGGAQLRTAVAEARFRMVLRRRTSAPPDTSC